MNKCEWRDGTFIGCDRAKEVHGDPGVMLTYGARWSFCPHCGADIRKPVEKWVDIPEFCGEYEVSNLGRVRSNKYRNDKSRTEELKGSVSKEGYRSVCLTRSGVPGTFRVSQLVFKAFHGEIAEGQQIDHINRDPTDDRAENLRAVTLKENARNQGKKTKSSSKFKGVSWHKRDKVWTAQIRVEGRLMALGYYDDEYEAARAYDKKVKEVFSTFAVTNEELGLFTPGLPAGFNMDGTPKEEE